MTEGKIETRLTPTIKVIFVSSEHVSLRAINSNKKQSNDAQIISHICYALCIQQIASYGYIDFQIIALKTLLITRNADFRNTRYQSTVAFRCAFHKFDRNFPSCSFDRYIKAKGMH